MAQAGKQFDEGSESTASSQARNLTHDLTQLDFEVDFFSKILSASPEFVDVLRVGSLLSLKGRFVEGLKVDKQLVRLRPDDALAHYNLACSYALVQRPEQSIRTLKRAVELGYSDFRYMREDHDLDAIKQDPRFRQMLREFESS